MGAAISRWIALATGQTLITMVVITMIVTNTLQEVFPAIALFLIGH
jgi:hypothetical protein